MQRPYYAGFFCAPKTLESIQSEKAPELVQRFQSGYDLRSRASTVSPRDIGVVAFLVSLIVLLILAGPLTCSDGWHSPSIGRQGACSWHGGVDYTPRFFAFLVSVFVGLFAFFVSAWLAHKLSSKKTQRQFNEHRQEFKGGVAHDAVACPLCGYPMMRRLARKGPRKGKHFLGCSRFPVCRGTREIVR
jgi:hypothetical protein